MSRGLAVRRPHQLDRRPAERRWLVDGLWADEAVGVVGGEPKCFKSILSLHVAVSVATGAPCLGRFETAQPGSVLLFAAEDALAVVRQRLEAIAVAHDVDFDALDIHVIVEPSVRLDIATDRQRLQETVDKLRPRLLILDPFVRLHASVDENSSGDVAPILAYLRQLQRRCHTAVMLVHHARKGASGARAGQALRGSSEFHAWGDSNLYLRRRGEALLLSIEHRAAASIDNLALELESGDAALALHVVEDDDVDEDSNSSSLSVDERILRALRASPAPLSRQALRAACRMRMSTLCDALGALTESGRVRKSAAGYELSDLESFPVSVSQEP